MSRPLCSADVRTLALAACLGAFACDAGSQTPDGSGGEAESVPVGSAPVRLEAVPEPAIDWRPEVYVAGSKSIPGCSMRVARYRCWPL